MRLKGDAVKISARKSDLARLQAYLVGEALQKSYPELKIEYLFRESLGDKNLNDPLWKMPEKGVFTEDFLQDLVSEQTDLVVHSWKDLPTEKKAHTKVVATLARADQRDLMLVKRGSVGRSSWKIFSSSPRRAHNLKDFLPEVVPACESVEFIPVRGNIPTRIKKLMDSTEADALIVAKAAIDRLLATRTAEFEECRNAIRAALKICEFMILPLSINPNAPAQGAIAVEIKSGRAELEEMLAKINNANSFKLVEQERNRLAELGGGCHQKIGVCVLHRPYGEIYYEKGITDQGQVLEKATLRGRNDLPQLKAENLWALSAEKSISRESHVLSPDNLRLVQASNLWIARAEAWPAQINFQLPTGQLRWAAGINTWKKLAAKGLWVHGCAESLGELENPNIELIAKDAPFDNWLKLSHNQVNKKEDAGSTLSTYNLELEHVDWQFRLSGDKNRQHQFFFWRSGSQFLRAIKEFPALLEKLHASGPGMTHECLLKYLDPKKVFVFLNESDWRAQCQS